MPSAKNGARRATPVFDLELLEARRRIAVLEIERAGANRAVNELLIRAWQLESQLAETSEALEAVDRRFRSHVRGEIARVTGEIERVRAHNAALHARLHALETNPLWKLEMRARRIAAALLKRGRKP